MDFTLPLKVILQQCHDDLNLSPNQNFADWENCLQGVLEGKDYQITVTEYAEGIYDVWKDELTRAILVRALSGLKNAQGALMYSSDAIASAVETYYPTTQPKEFTVAANQKWQDTGVSLKSGDKCLIEYLSGTWSASPWTGRVSAAGTPRFIAKPGYTYPGAYEGALIGEVGGHKFVIGKGSTIPQGVSGELKLCMNDDLGDRYGNGFSDNHGAVIVRISKN